MAKGMTRKEAEELVKSFDKKEPQWFCPLIPGPCNKMCVNFIPAFVGSMNEESKGMLHDVKEDSFIVSGFVCSNSQFLGNPMPCGGN